MKRIETNYEKLYIKGEKSGSATVTLTCDNPITVNIISYTNDLTGSISINTTGNNTNTVNINVEYADLYLNGETYSGVINASTSTDQLSIPIIINCSDTLIYTNIPNNVIEDVSNGFTIEYNSLPEVNSVKLVNDYDYQITDISNKLIEDDPIRRINLTEFELKNNDYIIASNELSQISTFINRNIDVSNIFRKITRSPIELSFEKQRFTISLYSLKNGIPSPITCIFPTGVKLISKKLTNTSNGLYEVILEVGENNSMSINSFKIEIKQDEYDKSLTWDVVQYYTKDVFMAITPSPISVDYESVDIDIKFTSIINLAESPILLDNIDFGGLNYKSLLSDGLGHFTMTVTVPTYINTDDNIYYREYNIKITNPNFNHKLSWDVIQFKEGIDSSKDFIGVYEKLNRNYYFANNTDHSTISGVVFNGESYGDITTAPFTTDSALIQFDIINEGGDYSNIFRSYYSSTSAFGRINLSDVIKFDIENKIDKRLTNISRLFNETRIEHIPSWLKYWDTSSVTDMSYAFYYNWLKDIHNLSTWDTSSVTDMSHMFHYNTGLTDLSPLANWDVSSVTKMKGIFSCAPKLTDLSPLANWDTSKVISMRSMFSACIKLTDLSPLANWDTSKVTDMSYMFQYCYTLTDLSPLANWDTSSVTKMSWMFYKCSNLTDLSPLANWDTSSVTDMDYMFQNCTFLTIVPLLDTSKVTNIYRMFYDCSSLTNLGGFKNLKCDLDLSDSPLLTHESLMNVINNLAESTATLTLGETNLNKLTSEEKAIAINKGWMLAY